MKMCKKFFFPFFLFCGENMHGLSSLLHRLHHPHLQMSITEKREDFFMACAQILSANSNIQHHHVCCNQFEVTVTMI